jgi:predicted esterase
MKLLRILAVILIVTAGGMYAGQDAVYQVKNGSITIDGNLEEWPADRWFPVSMLVSGEKHKPSKDLNVTGSFAFDSENFYVAVRAVDDKSVTVNRSWRYGDGFFFTLVTEENKERSRYVYQYGFSQQEKFLVFGNGEYFPRFDARDVQSKFIKHSDRVDYEIAIPYKLLKPFNPFIYKKVAMNLIYADRDEKREEIVMLLADMDFDTERTDRRGGRFFDLVPFQPRSVSQESYHFYLKKNFFKTGDTPRIRYAFSLEKGKTNRTVKIELIGKDEAVFSAVEKVSCDAGVNRGDFSLKPGNLPSGNYQIRFTVHDEQGKGVYTYSDDIFFLDQKAIQEYGNKMAVYKKNKKLAASLSNLGIRFQWFDDFYKSENYEFISSLNEWNEDILHLVSKLEKGEPAVFGKNVIKRYAHRSNIDNTLQPYSAYLPEGFGAGKTYPLIVALHGSGVDERGFFRFAARLLGSLGCPVIAPKARGLSDWYVGDSGKDVFECIEHFIRLYPNIDRERLFLTGFSMGGYGTWRLGLLKPNYFRGLVIISGALTAREGTGGENILDMIDKVRNENFLILHGDKDNAVPIENTRKAVEKLKALNAKVEYIEVPGAGHGNFDKNAEIIAWIKKHF